MDTLDAETRGSVATADTLADSAGGKPSAPPLMGGLREGDRLDHFVVMERLGEGGMGVVLAAYDPDLDRKVAIKLLRADAWGETAATKGRQRLLREAQAMARLSHPNVVVVHEVGVVEGRVFVAMEYVDGCTLGGWTRKRKRTWREVVEMYSRAGQGLAAAHEAGLVHRDFKPDNVLVGDDGRVRVTDFGIVGTRGTVLQSSESIEESEALIDDKTPLSVTLTREGTLLGTPMYMAPEQHERRPADERADQFSFCMALWEALYGERPFPGSTAGEVSRAMRRQEVRPPPSGTEVPAWVRAILLRGLCYRPEDRFPSMDALLDALGRDPLAARRRKLELGGIALGFAVLAGVAVYGLLRGPADGPRCANAGRALRGVWDEEVAQKVEQGFAATGSPLAAGTFTRVAALLDRYAADWVAMRTEACEATHVRGEQSDTMLALRNACLDRRLGDLRELALLFAEDAQAETVQHAVEAASSLASLGPCADRDALWNTVPPPADADTAEKVEVIEGWLSRAAALYRTGEYAAGLDIATAQAAEARTVGHLPTRARALWWKGRLQRKLGQTLDAEATLRDAVQVAAQAKDDSLVAAIWLEVVGVLADRGDYDEARVLHGTVDAAVARAGNDPAQRAALLRHLGLLLRAEGKLDQARDRFAEALAIWQKTRGEESLEVAAATEDLADVVLRQGRFEEAHSLYLRALDVWEKSLGATHGKVAGALVGVGRCLDRLDRTGEAVGFFARALRVGGLAADSPLRAEIEAWLAAHQSPHGPE